MDAEIALAPVDIAWHSAEPSSSESAREKCSHEKEADACNHQQFSELGHESTMSFAGGDVKSRPE